MKKIRTWLMEGNGEIVSGGEEGINVWKQSAGSKIWIDVQTHEIDTVEKLLHSLGCHPLAIKDSFNNVTAKKAKDGSITIHFGGDPKADNFLPIVPGWNYIARLYKPGPEILDSSWNFIVRLFQPKKEIIAGSWTFPSPKPVE